MRAFLRVDDSEEDTLITSLVQSAIASLDGREGLLGRAIVSQTWRLDCVGPVVGIRAGIIRLRLGNVLTISSVTSLINGSSTPWTGFQLQHDEIGAYVEPQESQSWPSYDQRDDAISVTFTAGYGAASAVPETVKHAIKVLAAARYHNRESAVYPPGFLQLIAPFRHVNL